MTSKRMVIMLVACGVIFGGIFGMDAMMKKGMNDYFDNMPVPPQTISTARAERMIWPAEIDSVGTFSAINGTDISVETEGVVAAIHVASGANVTRGELLLELDSRLARAELDRLEAQARLARLNLERRQDLLRKKAISQAEVDAAQAEADAAAAAAQAQRVRVAKHRVTAPFDGRVGIRRISLGQYLSQGTPLFTLQALDPIEIEFAVAEKHLPQIRPNQQVNISVDAYPKDSFSGEINALDPRVDTSTRMVRVRARIPNPDGKLRSGMFGRLSIELSQKLEVIAVPRTAIKYDPYGQSVFVVTPKEQQGDGPAHLAQHRFVRTGVARGDFLQILEGLEEGDEIVTSGLLKLRNGQPLIINNQVTPQVRLTPPASDA